MHEPGLSFEKISTPDVSTTRGKNQDLVKQEAQKLFEGQTTPAELMRKYPKLWESILQINAKEFSKNGASKKEEQMISLRRMPLAHFEKILRQEIQKNPEIGEDIEQYAHLVKDGELFSAHGVAAGTKEQQLHELIVLLSVGIGKGEAFFSTTYTKKIKENNLLNKNKKISGVHKDGIAVLLAPKRERLLTGCEHPNDPSCHKLNIETVVLNKIAYAILPELEIRYPHIRFVRGDEQVLYFERYDQGKSSILHSIDSILEGISKTGRGEASEDAFLKVVTLLKADHRFQEIYGQYSELVKEFPDRTEEYEIQAIKAFREVYPSFFKKD